MGAERRAPVRQQNQRIVNQRNMHYVDGNNARRLMPAPEREHEARPKPGVERQKRVRRREKAAKAIQVSRGIDFLTMVFLTAVIAFTVLACFRYLELQSENKQLDKDIQSSQVKLDKLVDKNNASAKEFDKAINFDEVYEIAVGELGMVFPNENQVISYEKKIHEYMRQQEIIGDVKMSTLLEKIFGSFGG